MARSFRMSLARRVGNAAITLFVTRGLAPPNYVLLLVPGRRTGETRSTPLRVLRHESSTYLVAPYGAVGWVHNARAAGAGDLRRGRRTRHVRLEECDPAGPVVGEVLKEYVAAVPVTRSYFDAAVEDPPERFAAEAAHHPVFRVRPPEA